MAFFSKGLRSLLPISSDNKKYVVLRNATGFNATSDFTCNLPPVIAKRRGLFGGNFKARLYGQILSRNKSCNFVALTFEHVRMAAICRATNRSEIGGCSHARFAIALKSAFDCSSCRATKSLCVNEPLRYLNFCSSALNTFEWNQNWSVKDYSMCLKVFD